MIAKICFGLNLPIDPYQFRLFLQIMATAIFKCTIMSLPICYFLLLQILQVPYAREISFNR